jgi:hypothetical protein
VAHCDFKAPIYGTEEAREPLRRRGGHGGGSAPMMTMAFWCARPYAENTGASMSISETRRSQNMNELESRHTHEGWPRFGVARRHSEVGRRR